MSSIKLFNSNLKQGFYFVSHASFATNRVQLKAHDDVHVTFPPQKNETTQTPVVLLLGWLGCQDRHLKKYSKIYEDRGLITVRYTAPGYALFFRTSKMWKIADGLLKTLDDHQLQDHPIVIHGFSNGGAYCFRYISSIVQNTKRPMRIRGSFIYLKIVSMILSLYVF